MFSLLSIVDLGPDASADDIARLVKRLGEEAKALRDVTTAHAGATLPDALYGGHILWRLAFASEQHCWDCLASSRWHDRITPLLDGLAVDSVAYRPIRSQVAAQSGRGGIWRCLVLAVEPGTTADDIRAFEQETVLMPDHVSTIRSWAFGRVMTARGRRRWTHVWEQEFDDIAGLNGEYMLNPVHWGFIDRWYDPESPQRIVDIGCIVHAACARDGAVIP